MGSKEDDIHAAARNGNVTEVELIISSNPLTVNSRDKHSRTPLHLAAWGGHANVVSALCKHKADVGAAAMDDMAAIHFAAQKGHLDVIKTLVSAGVSVKAINRKGMNALHYAVQGSYVELTKYLLKKGFNLDAKTKAGKSVFDFATNEEIRTLLAEHEQSKQTDVPASKETVVKKIKEGEPGALLEEKGEEGKLEETDEDNRKRKGDEKDEEVELEETNEDNLERKGEEDDVQESSPKPKKSKVFLNHLLASDDTQEDEEQ